MSGGDWVALIILLIVVILYVKHNSESDSDPNKPIVHRIGKADMGKVSGVLSGAAHGTNSTLLALTDDTDGSSGVLNYTYNLPDKFIMDCNIRVFGSSKRGALIFYFFQPGQFQMKQKNGGFMVMLNQADGILLVNELDNNKDRPKLVIVDDKAHNVQIIVNGSNVVVKVDGQTLSQGTLSTGYKGNRNFGVAGMAGGGGNLQGIDSYTITAM